MAPTFELLTLPDMLDVTPTGYSTTHPQLEVATVQFGPFVATDEFGGATVACTPESGSVFEAHSTTVQCVATDRSGLTARESFTVSIATANAPTFTASVSVNAQSKIEKEATSAPRTMVEFMAPVAMSAFGQQLIVTCTPSSPAMFEKRTTQVVCDTKDAGGKVIGSWMCSFVRTQSAQILCTSFVIIGAGGHPWVRGNRHRHHQPCRTCSCGHGKR